MEKERNPTRRVHRKDQASDGQCGVLNVERCIHGMGQSLGSDVSGAIVPIAKTAGWSMESDVLTGQKGHKTEVILQLTGAVLESLVW